MEIRMPWPPTQLSPNARVHWAAKAKVAKSYKLACLVEARRSGVVPIKAESVEITMKFCPPDARRRDRDNMVASAKYLIDGLALALGIDDRVFELKIERGEPVKGGAVMIGVVY